jgi:hypothetical protein
MALTISSQPIPGNMNSQPVPCHRQVVPRRMFTMFSTTIVNATSHRAAKAITQLPVVMFLASLLPQRAAAYGCS